MHTIRRLVPTNCLHSYGLILTGIPLALGIPVNACNWVSLLTRRLVFEPTSLTDAFRSGAAPQL